MRITALLILFLCTTKLQGQSANTLEQAKTAFKFETSYLNTFTGDAFSGISGLDVNIGLERSKRFNDRFAFDYGFGLGLTAMNFKKPGSFFISRFRNQLIPIVSLEQVRQLNINIPLNLSYAIKQSKAVSTRFVVGINTQLNMLASFEGEDWQEREKIFVNQLSKSDEFGASGYHLLNDLRPHLGTAWSMDREQGILNMRVGIEYSYFSRTLGAYGKVAYSFDLKK
ncbi:MAG: outer membrane beta-barrel protein [Saprospiraceae bacterium]|nr:outer membrane beta-barrel protein [Saprospiraceae bacterium]